MSAIIALLLMQAIPVEDKIYHDDNGFVVGRSDGSCFVQAKYNSGIETNIFADKENGIYLMFSQKNWSPVEGKRYKFKITFGDEYYDVTAAATKVGGFVAYLHPDFLESYAITGGVDILWGSKSIASLNLLGSSKAIAALRLCMKETGIVLSAPAQQLTPVPRVSSDPFDRSKPAAMRYYFGHAYPVQANGSEGVVKAAVKVDATGRVIDCNVLETSGNAILDEAACIGLRKSSFTAAKDRAGQPMDSVIERSVRFEDPSKTVEPG